MAKTMRTLKGDVIFKGKIYEKGKHEVDSLPDDFPGEEELNEKIDKAGKTEGLRVSARQAAAAAAEEDTADDDLDLDDLGDEEGEEGDEDAPQAKGKVGNEAGMKGNSGKPRTKPKKK